MEDPPEEASKLAFYEAKKKEETFIYLVDKQALKGKLLKLIWLDVHGNCVWTNRLRVGGVLEFTGALADGGSLADQYESYVGEDGSFMYQTGALLRFW